MSRPATSLPARLRARTISLPLPLPRAQRPFSLNADAAKAQAAQWEPTLHLDALHSATTEQQDGEDRDGGDVVHMSCMTTYSAFDPGATRPLLQSGVGVPVSVQTLGVVALPDMVARRGVDVAATETEEIGVSDGENSHTTTTSTTTAVTLPSKPWPYSLPTFLRPKVGTTFEMMHHNTITTSTDLESIRDEKSLQRIGVLQALLYGVPEPEKFSYAKEVVGEGGVLHKVLYGVKDIEGGGGGETAAVVVRDVKVEIDGHQDDSKNGDVPVVVIQEVEVKKTDLEKEEEDMSRVKEFEMIAK